jgi:hypothetical protein
VADGRYRLHWSQPTDTERRAWANRDDATRDGAYCVVLAAAEVHLGLVAIGRAEASTGADYYLGRPGDGVNVADGELDFEGAIRIEISGLDRGTETQLLQRVAQKVGQARRGKSNLPAMAGVAGFGLLRVVFRRV